jgi:membrane-associated phospholipid phosphatase
MTQPDPARRTPRRGTATDRRTGARGHLEFFWNLIFRALRAFGVRADHFYTSVGIFLVAGATVAVICTVAFAALGLRVRSGATQAFDLAVMRWMGAHQSKTLSYAADQLTHLGTGIVVLTVVGVTALLLWNTAHKHSARLLLAAVAGNIILNNVLKLLFDRPRPDVFVWQTTALSSSFPSGHAMSATVCYGTVAYLAARLQKHHWARALTLGGAAILILLICGTRMYLGVHYPSDVIAGMLVGLAWAGFCMATLEASLALARRRAPRSVVEERRAPQELA